MHEQNHKHSNKRLIELKPTVSSSSSSLASDFSDITNNNNKNNNNINVIASNASIQRNAAMTESIKSVTTAKLNEKYSSIKGKKKYIRSLKHIHDDDSDKLSTEMDDEHSLPPLINDRI